MGCRKRMRNSRKRARMWGIVAIGLGLAAAGPAWAANLIANPTFQGTGGERLNVIGTIPDQWRGFSVGGSTTISVIPLEPDALYAGSPSTNAVKLNVVTFGSDQGIDNNNARFKVFGNSTYRLEFYVKTGNADTSSQSFRYSFPLFDSNGTYTGREPGTRNATASSTWTKIVGPSFTDVTAAYAHIAFRVINNGGENAILVALPDVQGPLERFDAWTSSDLAERQSWTASDRLIGTTYFYWYRWPDQHFFDGAGYTDDALTDHFVDPTSVDMYDVQWHKQEVDDMITAGIDMIWPVYWGAPGNFDTSSHRYAWEALVPLQTAIEALAAEGKTPPRIGMYYDTSSLINGVRGARPTDGGADLTTPEGKEVFYGTIRSFFCNVRPRHWACIDGQPVVVLYSAGFAERYSQDAFNYAKSRFAAEFGGITPYIIREGSWNVAADAMYRWGAALRGPYIDSIAALGPGYNDTAVPGRSTPIRMREDGNYYRWSWLQVLRAPVNIVHVETWNEMHEGTTICATAEYGREYIDLTAYYAAHFKAGTVPDETIVLRYPYPEPRPPNMQDGTQYAGARSVEVYAAAGQKIHAGIDTPAGGDGSISLVSYAGDSYLRTDIGYVSRYAYFGVKDPFYFDQRRRVRLTIEYLDEGAATAQLQYDSYDTAAFYEGSYTTGPTLALSNTRTLRSWSVTLQNARFVNRQNSGADFRLYVTNGPLYIKRVHVEVLDVPEPILRVIAMNPAPGATVGVLTSINAQFTTSLLTSSVNAYTFKLVRSGDDGIFGNTNDVTISASGFNASGLQAVMRLNDADLPNDAYRVTLVGRGASPILDFANKPLDGRFTGSFPSGDGTGAEDFVAQFVLNVGGDAELWELTDFDGDSDVDLADFDAFHGCFNGPNRPPVYPGCGDTDLDSDNDVDLTDFGGFARCFNGHNRPPACH